jgi:hypothetical protein
VFVSLTVQVDGQLVSYPPIPLIVLTSYDRIRLKRSISHKFVPCTVCNNLLPTADFACT